METESSFNTSQVINVGPRSSNCPTRSEFFREQEDPRKIEAIERLESIGVFVPMSSLELYHGRDPNGDKEEWSVKTDFSNAGNNTGNQNVNKINALNTGDFNTARDFATERIVQKFHEPWEEGAKEDRRRIRSGEIPIEVHRIISSDPNAIIIDLNKASKERENITKSIAPLLPAVLEASPVDFEYRETLPLLLRTLKEDFNITNKSFIGKEEIPQILQRLKERIRNSSNPLAIIDEKLVTHIAGGINSLFLLKCSFPNLIDRYAFHEEDTLKQSIETKSGKTMTYELPFNRDYIARFIRSNHIVGIKTTADSATLDRNISNTILVDLTKINTVDQVREKEDSFEKVFGDLSNEMDKSLESSKSHPLVKLLSENYFATPKEILEEAKKVKGFENLFDADAGNWEGFTLGEHTETVLRMFDETFADVLPAKLLPVMRLALLTHDLGKPEAVKQGKKEEQKQFNLIEGEKFLNELGIEKNLQTLILGIIGEGQELTSKIFVKKKNESSRLMEFSKKLLEGFRGNDKPVKFDDMRAIYYMAFMVQNSDSGAYTDYGTTRRSGFMFRNNPSFNDSFKNNSLDRRGATLLT